MLGWKGVVLLCRLLGLYGLCSVLSFRALFLPLQAFWPGHLDVDKLNVVRSIAGCFLKPLPLAKDGDLKATVKPWVSALYE